jgi:hypothetical protein
VVNEITFPKIDCDFSIGRALFEDPVGQHDASLEGEVTSHTDINKPCTRLLSPIVSKAAVHVFLKVFLISDLNNSRGKKDE